MDHLYSVYLLQKQELSTLNITQNKYSQNVLNKHTHAHTHTQHKLTCQQQISTLRLIVSDLEKVSLESRFEF